MSSSSDITASVWLPSTGAAPSVGLMPSYVHGTPGADRVPTTGCSICLHETTSVEVWIRDHSEHVLHDGRLDPRRCRLAIAPAADAELRINFANLRLIMGRRNGDIAFARRFVERRKRPDGRRFAASGGRNEAPDGVDDNLEHADLDVRTASGQRASAQGLQDGQRHICACQDVRHDAACEMRFAERTPGGGCKSAERCNAGVICCVAAPWADSSERADGGEHDVRPLFAEQLVGDAEIVGGPTREIFQDDVRLAYELPQDLPAVGGFQVDFDTSFATIGMVEVRAPSCFGSPTNGPYIRGVG